MVNSVECSTYIEQGQKKGDLRSIDSPFRYPRGGEQGEFPWSVPYGIPTDKLARDYLCPDKYNNFLNNFRQKANVSNWPKIQWYGYSSPSALILILITAVLYSAPSRKSTQ